MEESYTAISYSALSNGTGMVGMLAAWLLVRHRIKQAGNVVPRSVMMMRNFFLLFGIFYIFITFPFFYLYFAPQDFGSVMAVGFTIGHAFLFAAMTYTLRLLFSLLPRLSDKERYAMIGGAIAVAWVFILALTTMVFGVNPEYDYVNHLVNYQQHPLLANTIAIGALIAWGPLGVILLVNAAKSRGWRRLRSLMLGLGFLTVMTAGPLHGLAENYQQLLIADLVTIVGLLLLAIAIVFRIGANLKHSEAQSEVQPEAHPS